MTEFDLDASPINLDDLTQGQPSTTPIQDAPINLDQLPRISDPINLDQLPSAAPIALPPSIAQPPARRTSGDRVQFGLGLERGFFETGQTAGGGVEAAGKFFGIDFITELGESLRTASAEELAPLEQPRVARIEDITTTDEALDWFFYQLGNAVPSSVGSVAAGAAGTAIAGPVGGFVGLAGISYILGAGEVYVNLLEEGVDRPAAALEAGLPLALLDVVTPGRLFGKLVWKPTDLVRGGVRKAAGRIAREGATSFGTEALTEAGQEAVGAGFEARELDRDFLTPETMSRVLNSFAAGGVAGAGLGATAQFGAEVLKPRSQVKDQGELLPDPTTIPGETEGVDSRSAEEEIPAKTREGQTVGLIFKNPETRDFNEEFTKAFDEDLASGFAPPDTVPSAFNPQGDPNDVDPAATIVRYIFEPGMEDIYISSASLAHFQLAQQLGKGAAFLEGNVDRPGAELFTGYVEGSGANSRLEVGKGMTAAQELELSQKLQMMGVRPQAFAESASLGTGPEIRSFRGPLGGGEITHDFQKEEVELPDLIEPEQLFSDPDIPFFQTPRGASELLPTDDIFVVADKVDLPARAREFHSLYFKDAFDIELLDVIATDFSKKFQTNAPAPGLGGQATTFFTKRGQFETLSAAQQALLQEEGLGGGKNRVQIGQQLTMTPYQFDSILLHEMAHTENDTQRRLSGEKRQSHGKEWKKVARRVARASGIAITTKHNIAVNQFGTPAFREFGQKLTGTVHKLAETAVETIGSTQPEFFLPNSRTELLTGKTSPLLHFNRYKLRRIADEFTRRGVSNEKLAGIISKRFEPVAQEAFASAQEEIASLEMGIRNINTVLKGLEGNKESVVAKRQVKQKERLVKRLKDLRLLTPENLLSTTTAKVIEALENSRQLKSRAEPIVTLYTNKKDGAYIERVVQMTAPEGTKEILVEDDRTPYEYEKGAKGVYKIEINHPKEVLDRMGHVIAESWLDQLTPTQREALSQAYVDETRNEKEAPSYGEWVFNNAGLRPELAKLNSALRYHHGISDIRSAFGDWMQALGAQSKIEMPGTTDQVPNPGKTPGDTKDAKDSLASIFDGQPPGPTGKENELTDDPTGGDFETLNTSLDKAGWFRRNVLTLLQFAAANAHVKPLQAYVDRVQKFWGDKGAFTQIAQEQLNKWGKLSKEQSDKLSRFLFEQTIQSDRLDRRLGRNEQIALKNKLRLPDELFAMAESIDADMTAVMQQFKEQSLFEVEQRLKEDPAAAAKLQAQINLDYQKLENRNYFPMSRFGKHTILVKAKVPISRFGKEFKVGETVSFYTFERDGVKAGSKVRNSALEGVQKQFPSDKYAVSTGQMEDSEFAFQGFPPSLITAMESDLDLTKEQKNRLQEAFVRLSPGEGFRKNLLKRRGIVGFSEDGLRTYGSYMFHASNHFARLKNYRELAGSINAIGAEVKEVQRRGGRTETRTLIQQTMNEHYRYLMNPGNEMAELRSFIFKWYFVGNARQLLVNLTQVPLVTYGYLAARHGDVSSGRELAKAYGDIIRRRPLKDLELDLITRGIREGFMDESMVTELAAASHGEVLQRMRSQGKTGQLVSRLGDLGLWPFRWSEGVNRRVSFLSAIRLEQLKGNLDPESLFLAGRHAVQTTQAEYARWNRMPIARGTGPVGVAGPVALVFKSFQFHMLWFYATQPGRGRALVALLAMAGIMGLPGAEDVADIVDALVTKMGQAFGWKDPKFSSRQWIREATLAMGAAPDLAMHGASRYTMGLYGLNMLTGLPIPALDLSGSLSLGRVFPGVRSLTSPTADMNQRVTMAVEDVGGVAAGLGISFGRALFNEDPNTFRVLEGAAPPVLKNMIAAVRALSEGGYTDRAGAELVPLDPYDAEHSAELLARFFLGAQSTRLRQRRELDWARLEATLYYQLRRELVLKDVAFAKLARDREGMSDAIKALKQYNRTAPRGLGISSTDMMRSLESRVKNARLRELGLPRQSRYFPLVRSFDASFPQLGD